MGKDQDDSKPLDLDDVRELIDLLIEKDVAELEIEQAGVTVKIRRSEEAGVSQVIAAAPSAAPTTPASSGTQPAQAAGGEEPQTPAEAAGLQDAFVVTSPIVGTFYRAPEPEADPFVEVGDQVEEGQTLCIVEAMKLMNEINAEVAGEVVAIFVDNAEPIEYGQQLFAIRPS